MRARDVASQVQSLEHLRNYEMDCVSDPEVWLAARQAELANVTTNREMFFALDCTHYNV